MDPNDQNPTSPNPGKPGDGSTVETIICRECGKPFDVTIPAGQAGRFLRLVKPTICDTCAPILDARYAAEDAARELAERMAEREEYWLANVPPLYRATDMNKLPPEAERAIAAVAAWKYGPKGIGVCGDSRRGKTRVIYLLLDRMLRQEGRRFLAMTTAEFSHKVSRYASDDVKELDLWLERLCKVPLLFIDDVGKGRMTDRVESELYHVIETRTSHEKPILFTANATGDALVASMSADRGVPIIERLREFCEIVVV